MNPGEKNDNEYEPQASKIPENLREDIMGIKAIIDSLNEEANKLENRRKVLQTEYRNNENLLNVVFEEIARDHKTFLSKLQDSQGKGNPVPISRGEVFIKRNFRKIKEALDEKSVNLDLEMKKSFTDATPDNFEGTTLKSTNYDKHSDQILRFDSENFYIQKKLGKVHPIDLPSELRALARVAGKESS